jgi:hypothetical protein
LKNKKLDKHFYVSRLITPLPLPSYGRNFVVDDRVDTAPVSVLQPPSPVAFFTDVVFWVFFFFLFSSFFLLLFFCLFLCISLLLFVVGLYLPKLMWFDPVEKTFALDTVSVPLVVGFVPTFIHVVLIVVGLHEGLMDLSRFMPLACAISSSKLATLTSNLLIESCHSFVTSPFIFCFL